MNDYNSPSLSSLTSTAHTLIPDTALPSPASNTPTHQSHQHTIVSLGITPSIAQHPLNSSTRDLHQNINTIAQNSINSESNNSFALENDFIARLRIEAACASNRYISDEISSEIDRLLAIRSQNELPLQPIFNTVRSNPYPMAAQRRQSDPTVYVPNN